MELRLFQVDAFADRPFAGNPAAVCPLDDWLPDDVMQSIAIENNLSETAFFIPDGEDFRLRWFTPGAEVELCGHATLATAWVIMERLEPGRDRVAFETLSGTLTVVRDDGLLAMDFPVWAIEPFDDDGAIAAAIGATPLECLRGPDDMAVLADEAAVRAVAPDLARVAALPGRGLIVTATGEDCDFVSRFFAPNHGIPEDPVTGSAHCMLTPYWAARLGKTGMSARQISARGGNLRCRLLEGGRVQVAGRVAPYMEGTIRL